MLLHPTVSNVLWVKVGDELNLPWDDNIRRSTVAKLVHRVNRHVPPKTLVDYQNLTRLYNHLVDLYDELWIERPFPSVEAMETELSNKHPIVRLTSTASKLLYEEMNDIEQLLYQARLLMSFD